MAAFIFDAKSVAAIFFSHKNTRGRPGAATVLDDLGKELLDLPVYLCSDVGRGSVCSLSDGGASAVSMLSYYVSASSER